MIALNVWLSGNEPYQNRIAMMIYMILDGKFINGAFQIKLSRLLVG